MKIISGNQFLQTYQSPFATGNLEELDTRVKSILEKVRTEGDKALRELTEKFDGATIDHLIVSKAEIEEAKGLVDRNFITAIRQAAENIDAFHRNQKEASWFTDDQDGIILGQKVTPIEKVGVYVPGGKANYPSTVLMNVIPAKIAGVQEISIATPPRADGTINPYVLVAASIVGVSRIYKMGGAQAIAALTYGTETVDRVYKIVGPGNNYVARAKKWVYGDVAIDMIAGPSEICIIADEEANPSFVAADLLSQAEHDEEAKSICITTSKTLANKVAQAVANQLSLLDRGDIAQASIRNNGKIILVDSEREAYEIANFIAPEHLQLMVSNPEEKIPMIKNAGAIFLGAYSPEPLGDYLAGPNHTLPTNGTAKFSSPLGVYDFVKKSSIISYSKEALRKVSKSIECLANTEGLEAHAQSIKIRGGN
ncbi:histidinol dehydrogenase [Ornithinibacillus californiensis]|uniref:histidinol dehydrogenase n=1 Tax=Ornithinibacillus californiensis TaxID=161536 RepID=UPI00064DE970|nr:histidinol dehydrogenase [Ornithinibacillus californiensis]